MARRDHPAHALEARAASALSERLRIADQIVPTLTYGDAIGNDAFELQRLFWRRGVQSEISALDATGCSFG